MICAKCGKETYCEERYSYAPWPWLAGRYCSDECWRNSGVDPDAELDPNEVIEPEDY